MDIIKIDNLEVFAYHGVFAHEKKKGQKFYINASLYTDTRNAGMTDELNYSTHYGEVCSLLNEQMKTNTYNLIEAAAEHLAEAVLLSFPLIKKIDLEVRKPEAPIELPFESVSVKISRKWHKVYLSLGSNLGDRENYINEAIAKMKQDKKLRVNNVSDIFRTVPYGDAATEEFLNGAVEIETLYYPEELLGMLHRLEAEAGRERTVRWGNRTLDLDILLFDDIMISSETLTIPHPDMTNRDFVLIPLAQIAPYAMHPVFHKTVKIMLDKLVKANNKFMI